MRIFARKRGDITEWGTRPLSYSRVSVPDLKAPARALSGAGRDIGRLGQQVFQFGAVKQRLEHETAARESLAALDDKLQDLLLQPPAGKEAVASDADPLAQSGYAVDGDMGLLLRKSGAAKDLLPRFKDQASNTYRSLKEKLTGRALQQFERQAPAILSAAAERIAHHQSVESRNHMMEVAAANISRFEALAVHNFAKPGFDQAIENLRQEHISLAPLLGEQEVSARMQQTTSNVYSRVIARAMNTDIDAAIGLFEGHHGKLLPEAKGAITRQLEMMKRQRLAKEVAEKAEDYVTKNDAPAHSPKEAVTIVIQDHYSNIKNIDDVKESAIEILKENELEKNNKKQEAASQKEKLVLAEIKGGINIDATIRRGADPDVIEALGRIKKRAQALEGELNGLKLEISRAKDQGVVAKTRGLKAVFKEKLRSQAKNRPFEFAALDLHRVIGDRDPQFLKEMMDRQDRIAVDHSFDPITDDGFEVTGRELRWALSGFSLYHDVDDWLWDGMKSFLGIDDEHTELLFQGMVHEAIDFAYDAGGKNPTGEDIAGLVENIAMTRYKEGLFLKKNISEVDFQRYGARSQASTKSKNTEQMR